MTKAQFEITVYPKLKNVNPKTVQEKGKLSALSQHNKIVRASFEELHSDIFPHIAWSPAIFTSRTRRAKDVFQAMDIICIDIDKNVRVADIVERLKKLNWCYSITPSTNNMLPKEKEGVQERFHIVLPLSKRIHTEEQHIANFNHFVNIFSDFEVDMSLKDCAKYLLPSSGAWNEEQSSLQLFKDDGLPFPVQEAIPNIQAIPKRINEDKKILDKESFKQLYYNFELDCILDIESHNWVQQILQDPGHAIGNWTLPLNRLVYCQAALGKLKEIEESVEFVNRFAPSPCDNHDILIIAKALEDGKKIQIFDKVNKFTLDLKLELLMNSLYEKYKNMIFKQPENDILYYLKPDNTITMIDDFKKFIISDFQIIATKLKIMSIANLQHVCTFLPIKFQKTLSKRLVPVTLKEDDRPSFYKLPFLLENGPTPHFDNALSNTRNAHLLMAFIGSLFIPESNKKQAILLYGPSNSGKSQITEFLMTILKPVATVTTVSAVQEKHGTSSLIGKRLVLFNDASTARFYSSETFKQITGDNFLFLERKYKDPTVFQCDCKIIIATNFEADIHLSEEASRNRVVIVEMNQPKDFKPIADFYKLLIEEAPKIIYKCIETYKQICPNNEIMTDSYSATKIEDMRITNNEEVISYIEEIFTIDKNSKMRYSEARKAIDEYCKNNFINYSKSTEIKKYMKDNVKCYVDELRRKWYAGIKPRTTNMLQNKILNN